MTKPYREALTAERLRNVLRYDEVIGRFFCLVSRGNRRAGDMAGSPNDRGYWNVMVDGILYKQHRLVWLYLHGEWPSSDLDHAKGLADTPGNLRQCTVSQNQGNSRRRRDNTSGFKGASFHKVTRKFQASIAHGRRQKYLGLYDTPEEAHSVYERAAIAQWGEFASNGE